MANLILKQKQMLDFFPPLSNKLRVALSGNQKRFDAIFFGFHVICIDFDLYEVRVLVLFVHNLALSKPILREV